MGHIISKQGIAPDPTKIALVRNYLVPGNKKELKSFLGLASYYRRFIENFSKIIYPMNRLLKMTVAYTWDSECEEAFSTLKEKLMNPPLLQNPDFAEPFVITTHASKYAIGCILSQWPIWKDRPIAYGGRLLSDAETRCSTTEQEMLEIVYACKLYRTYVFGTKFLVITDHKSLTNLIKYI